MAAIGLALVVTPRASSAQNSDPFFFSGDAAMAGGAVTATTRDAGSIWYNPAGLGGNRRTSLDISATTFGVRIRPLKDILRTQVGTEMRSVDLRSADILSVPNAIGFVRKLSDRVTIGAGLFVNQRDVRAAEDTLVTPVGLTPEGTPNSFRQRVDISTDSNGYHFGPAIGIEVSPTFRIGFSVFGTYRTISQFAQFSFDTLESGANGSSIPSFVVVQNRSTTTSFGMTFQGGLQWMPARNVQVGAVVRAPEFFLGASDRGANIVAGGGLSDTQASAFAFEQPKTAENAFAVVSPTRVVGAIAAMLGPRSYVAAEVDVQTGLKSSLVERLPVVNTRLGAIWVLSPEWKVGAGIFSDRAPIRTLVSLFDERVDYYGVSMGVEKRTPLALATDARPDALVLTTTIALRYAMGFANVRATDLDAAMAPRTISALYHDVMPYFGSAVLF